MNGHSAVVRLLLENGVDPESKFTYDQIPLSEAAEKGHEAIVKLLLVIKIVMADSKDIKCGRTPLSYAAGGGHEAIVKLLLVTKTVIADSRDTEYGRTPLSYAAERGHETVVRLLLEEGVDPNLRNYIPLPEG